MKISDKCSTLSEAFVGQYETSITISDSNYYKFTLVNFHWNNLRYPKAVLEKVQSEHAFPSCCDI